MKNDKLLGSGMLLAGAVIWGCAFVAQSMGMDYIGPFTFQTARLLLGGIVLLPVMALSSRHDKNAGRAAPAKVEKKALLTGGILCGVVLAFASNLQQMGIARTTVGKAGFLTALYILIVPAAGIFLKRKIRPLLWTCIALAAVGLYLLCMTETLTISTGDTYVILCSFLYTAHILLVDYFSPKVNAVKLSCVQFFVSGLLSGIPMLLFEHPRLPSILAAWGPIAYAGVLSCGVAYTLQIMGQRRTPPAIASLLMSLESVFALIAGLVLLGQVPTAREAVGCALMFTAIVIAQLPLRRVKLPDLSAI
jgi:drug/metabolite transporter (DMT)-like permease